MPQTRPHAPQLRGSLVGSTQVPLQFVRGDGHEVDVVQSPATQARPIGHTLPQRPQLAWVVSSDASHPLAAIASQLP